MTGHSSTDTRRAEFVEALDDLLSESFDQNWPNERKARERVLSLFDAATAVQGGEWVMVPRTPTKEMLEAMRYTSSVREMWDDALAAAPPVQVKGEAVALEPTPSGRVARPSGSRARWCPGSRGAASAIAASFRIVLALR